MRFIKAFSINDIKNIRRDSLLAYMLVIPWLMVLIIRLILPIADNWFEVSYQIPLETYYPLILSFFFILQVPLLFGVIYGLLLLDERDDNIFIALQVTPVSVEHYAVYRLLSTIVFSLVYVVLTMSATGLVEARVIINSIPAILLAGLLAVFVMLALVSFANNKLEGLALMKGMGILMLGPLVAYFLESKWQILLGILPSYWPAKAYWLASSGDTAWAYLTAGFVYLVILNIVVFRHLRRKLDYTL